MGALQNTVILDFRFEVEKYRQLEFLFRLDHLLVEAETLDFREV